MFKTEKEQHVPHWNIPFPTSTQSLFQSESKWEIFMLIGSDFNMNKTDIHNNDFARRQALKERLSETRKWSIVYSGSHPHLSHGREE